MLPISDAPIEFAEVGTERGEIFTAQCCRRLTDNAALRGVGEA